MTDAPTPALTGVPETMLWTLYGRARLAMARSDLFQDPEAIRLFRSIDFDFERVFGTPPDFFALRSIAIDRVVRRWLRRRPEGLVVSLGEGLETQAYRVDNGRMRWLSVDLPEGVALRERLLSPSERIRHLAMSAFDPAWMDGLDTKSGLLVIAQGLFMYFDADEVKALFLQMAKRFRGQRLVFDTVGRALKQITTRPDPDSKTYKPPPMVWGIERNEVAGTLRRWDPGLTSVTHIRHREPTGRPEFIEDAHDFVANILDLVVAKRRLTNCIWEVEF